MSVEKAFFQVGDDTEPKPKPGPMKPDPNPRPERDVEEPRKAAQL